MSIILFQMDQQRLEMEKLMEDKIKQAKDEVRKITCYSSHTTCSESNLPIPQNTDFSQKPNFCAKVSMFDF